MKIKVKTLDETKNLELEEKYKNSKLCVGIIMIDNYEEIMQRIPDEDKPVVIAKIENMTKNNFFIYNSLNFSKIPFRQSLICA